MRYLTCLIPFIIFYLSLSFFYATFDISLWKEAGRAFCIFLSLIFGLIVLALIPPKDI